MKTINIEIDNLKCEGCETTIANQLLKIEEVYEVTIYAKENRVQIKCDKAVREEKLIKTLSKLGYPKKGEANTFQKAKSYVSCAIGRFSN